MQIERIEMAPPDILCEFMILAVVAFLDAPEDYLSLAGYREFKTCVIKHLRRHQEQQRLPLFWFASPYGPLLHTRMIPDGYAAARHLNPNVVLKGHLFTSLVRQLERLREMLFREAGYRVSKVQEFSLSVPGKFSLSAPEIDVEGDVTFRTFRPFLRFKTLTVHWRHDSPSSQMWVGLLEVDGKQYHVLGRPGNPNTARCCNFAPPW